MSIMNRPAIIDIVFDGPPAHKSGRFIEVEDANGHGMSVGEWIRRNDGYWVLRIDLNKEARKFI